MSQLLDQTSQCVKCGLCLPVCPTYAEYQNEAYSPRGRLALIAALEEGTVDLDDNVDNRLDTCLLCRRCEKVCPSGVKFGAIMDQARTRSWHLRPAWQRAIVNLSNEKILGAATWVTQRSNKMPLQQTYRPKGKIKGKIGLFTGCTGKALDNTALHASIKLLNQLGFEVALSEASVCCGALHSHMGNTEKATQLLSDSLHSIQLLGADAIVTINPGCGAHLLEQSTLDIPVMDVSLFLQQEGLARRAHFNPLPTVAALHTPCTAENVLGSGQAEYALLKNIPEMVLTPVVEKGACCGAAGIHFLTHPKMAAKLREPYIDDIKQVQPEYLLSSNIGCAMHLARGLKDKRIKILHPISLLAQQIVVND